MQRLTVTVGLQDIATARGEFQDKIVLDGYIRFDYEHHNRGCNGNETRYLVCADVKPGSITRSDGARFRFAGYTSRQQWEHIDSAMRDEAAQLPKPEPKPLPEPEKDVTKLPLWARSYISELRNVARKANQ